jgi:hypothetical protein
MGFSCLHGFLLSKQEMQLVCHLWWEPGFRVSKEPGCGPFCQRHTGLREILTSKYDPGKHFYSIQRRGAGVGYVVSAVLAGVAYLFFLVEIGLSDGFL